MNSSQCQPTNYLHIVDISCTYSNVDTLITVFVVLMRNYHPSIVGTAGMYLKKNQCQQHPNDSVYKITVRSTTIEISHQQEKKKGKLKNRRN